MNNITLSILTKIWDYWTVDTYSLNGCVHYALVEIGNEMILYEIKND